MTENKRLLRWAGGLVGFPLGAAAYRAFAARRGVPQPRRLFVRTAVDPELLNDLVDLVGKVRGRAALEGADTFSVPIPDGVPEDAAYRELRALLEKWQVRHPGVRVEIVYTAPSGAGLDERPLTRSRLGAIKGRWRTKSV